MADRFKLCLKHSGIDYQTLNSVWWVFVKYVKTLKHSRVAGPCFKEVLKVRLGYLKEYLNMMEYISDKVHSFIYVLKRFDTFCWRLLHLK